MYFIVYYACADLYVHLLIVGAACCKVHATVQFLEACLMYLACSWQVRVLRPDGNGGRIEAVVLGRGQFVGERAVINDRLRSADCVAQGTVQVVVMRKRDFMDLDNPLLAWMLDYDAVSACLRVRLHSCRCSGPLVVIMMNSIVSEDLQLYKEFLANVGIWHWCLLLIHLVAQALPAMKSMKQEQMEQILDRFDAREEYAQGHILVNQGDLVSISGCVQVPGVCQNMGLWFGCVKSFLSRFCFVLLLLHSNAACNVTCYSLVLLPCLECWLCEYGATFTYRLTSCMWSRLVRFSC